MNEKNGHISGESQTGTFSRDNSNGTASALRRQLKAKTEKSLASASSSLRGVVRAAHDAIERTRTSVLSEDERQKVRDDRNALASLLKELDEIIG